MERALTPFLIALMMSVSGCDPGPRFERLDGSLVSVREIQKRIPEILKAARLPGLQVAIINDGQVVYTAGFGVKSIETQEPVDARTVFAALSFSKTLFTYLVMQLVDEGVLDLDEPLVSYLGRPLPEYDFYTDLRGDDRHQLLTRLSDILDVVRVEGETGSYKDPTWSADIDAIGDRLDQAMSGVVGDKTLAGLLDELRDPASEAEPAS